MNVFAGQSDCLVMFIFSEVYCEAEVKLGDTGD